MQNIVYILIASDKFEISTDNCIEHVGDNKEL